MKDHYATVVQAREVIDPFVKAWEVSTGLEAWPQTFLLVFKDAELIDRKPTPGQTLVVVGAPVGIDWTVDVRHPETYPPPPTGIHVDPNAEMMYRRYELYRLHGSPLGDLGNFCLTVLVVTAGTAQHSKAGKKYRVHQDVLNTLSTLTATKGGPRHARKAKGAAQPFTDAETKWIEEAVKILIRRAAEIAHGSKRLPPITMKDLPRL